ncbi:MAG: hypothetical protein K1X79_06445 [Oligoflexia bacterium]|nr:hypothetical protein [Oligoflexia bacterium]
MKALCYRLLLGNNTYAQTYRLKWCYSLIVVVALLTTGAAQPQSRTSTLAPNEDPRGPAELTLCSQNLENYGSFTDAKIRNPALTTEEFGEKERGLARRMAKAGCDVVAVQEVLGKSDEVALAALQRLAQVLQSQTNRRYESRVGPTLDKFSHVGYLLAVDRVTFFNSVSYEKIELPKLTDKEKPREFIRVPLEVQLVVKPLAGSASKTIGLVNIHFKSRRGASGDPAELEWETYRMQMAEAVRRIVEKRFARSLGSGESLLAVLGDRNSNFDTATARILEGSLNLRNFKDSAGCRLSKRGVPLCQAGFSSPAELFSVLTGDPQVKLQPGTQRYKGEYSWLDDILVPAESLRFAWRTFESVGDYDSGIVYEPTSASDHALVWVKFNW